MAPSAPVAQFIARWSQAEAAERANYVIAIPRSNGSIGHWKNNDACWRFLSRERKTSLTPKA